jgi:SPX domain protein involved in polyphosphate accumulation
LAEAQRKFENLKSELNEDNRNLLEKRKDKRSKSIAVEIAEDDNEDDDSTKARLKTIGESDEHNNNLGESTETSLRNRSRANGDNGVQLNNIFSGAQNITQRLLEKTRERKLKQKQFRKQHDLKLASSEFYLSLILLQNYQTLNFTGFRKILKKHDKVFKTERGNEWHKAYVEAAPFYTNKSVDSLIAEIENLFTQYFEHGDKQRAMKRLRVPPFEEKVIFYRISKFF